MLSKKTETAISKLLCVKKLELIEVLQKPQLKDLQPKENKSKILAFLTLKVKHTKCGTIYEANAVNISRCARAYCPSCNDNLELKQEAIKYAQSREGELLIWGGFIKNHSTFSCKNGHKFTTTWHTMKQQESWCRFCVKRFIPEKINKTNEITKAKKSLNGYIAADKKKNLTSDIDLEFVLNAKRSQCHYCTRMATGLDRIENSKGHTKENCIPSCIRCNWTRGSWTSYEVMLEIGKLLQRIDP